MVRQRVLWLMVALVLFGRAGHAQTVAIAQITGVVSDESGGALPGVEVQVTQTATGVTRFVVTDERGQYVLGNLPIGPYKLEAKLQGFNTYERTGLTLNVNDTVRVDAPLQVGEARESITVEANAVQVQSDSNEVSQTITAAQVADLATNGRNVIQLAALVPGASARSCSRSRATR